MSGIRKEWLFAAIISTCHASQHFFSRIIPPLIPLLTVELGLPLWQLGLLVSALSVGLAIGEAPVGMLSDRCNRRYILAPGLGIMGGSYIVVGIAPTVGSVFPDLVVSGEPFSGVILVMLTGMFLVGLGASVVHPTGYPMISSNVGEGRKGKVLGMWGSAAKLGDALAPAVIAILILVLSWDHILLLLGSGGIVFAGMVFVILSTLNVETQPPQTTNEEPTSDSTSENLNPRAYLYPLIAVFLFFVTRIIATQGVNTFVPAFIVDVYGYSLSAFGVTLAPESYANFYFSALLITAAFVQIITGELTDRFDNRTVIIAFLAISAVSLFCLSEFNLSSGGLLAVLLVVGGGLWGLNPARDDLVSEISPPEREGRTFGYLWTLTHIAGALSPIVIGYIAEISGIRLGFQYLALTTLLSAVAVAFLYSDRIYVPRDKGTSPGAADD